MRVNLLPLVFGSLMLLSVVFATNQSNDESNIDHRWSSQGGLAGFKANVFDALHVLSNRRPGGIPLADVGVTETAQDDNKAKMMKRHDNETDSETSFETATHPLPIDLTESKSLDISISLTDSTADTSTHTKAEATSDTSSTTTDTIISITGSGSDSITSSSSVYTSIEGTFTSTNGALSSTSTSAIKLITTSTLSARTSETKTTDAKTTDAKTVDAQTSPSSTSEAHATDNISDSLSTSIYTRTSALPNGSLSTMTSVKVVRVTPTGLSAEASIGSTGSSTTSKVPSAQKGVAALTTTGVGLEIMIMLGGAALFAMAL
ncbi:hypothetical protein N7520_005627 [Penicillium odoratum]|uniref:uncharacterized protein n=1 Tax=Penicillium odoratum TaxID=1167516 RepID=UPI002546EA80|nr:uncharacterized protein N7520_005627 [Penicillium odoratum]KAJ5758471.1 hypothetical protein N7520_005627 [Penicillium odoratum]